MEVVGMTIPFFSLVAVRNVFVFIMTAICYIKLFTNNWVNSVYMAEFFKVEGTKHVSVVCKGQSRHVQGFCFCYKFVQSCTGVQERIIGVYVKVYKVCFWSSFWSIGKNVIVSHEFTSFLFCRALFAKQKCVSKRMSLKTFFY